MIDFAALWQLRGEDSQQRSPLWLNPPKRFPLEENRPWKRAAQTLLIEKNS